MRYAEVELAAAAGRDEAPPVRVPRARRERVLGGVRDLVAQLARLDVPQPNLGRVVGTASGQVAPVRTPRQVGNAVRVALERAHVAQRTVDLCCDNR